MSSSARKDDFLRVIDKYCSKLIDVGYLGSLEPAIAIELSYDLEALGVTFLGVELWYLNDEGYIVENCFDDFTVSKDVLYEKKPSQTAQLCRDYIQNDMPQNIKYVSFVLGDEIEIEWLKQVCIHNKSFQHRRKYD